MIVWKAINKICWLVQKRKFKHVGTNSSISYGRYFVHPENIVIGDSFSAGKCLKLQTWPEYKNVGNEICPKIIVGDNVSMMDNCHISCARKIIIEDGVLFGDNVFVTDNFHGDNDCTELFLPPLDRTLYVKGPVYIEKNVWLGRNVCVMPGVTIGEGAVVGANSVVTRDIPPYVVAAGSPAKIIKKIIANE